MSANTIIKNNARQAIKQVIDTCGHDRALLCVELLKLYDLHLPKILESLMGDMVGKETGQLPHQFFIQQGLSRLGESKTFIIHNGYGDIEHMYIGTCRKGKKGKDYRHLCVSPEPFETWREQFGPLKLKVVYVKDGGFFKNEIDMVDLHTYQSLLNFANIADGAVFNNRNYRYHLDLSISFETFKEDMFKRLTPAAERTKFNMMDARPRTAQYSLIIDGQYK